MFVYNLTVYSPIMAKIPNHLVYNGFDDIPYVSKSILKNYYKISYIYTILLDNYSEKLDLLEYNFEKNNSKLCIGDVVCIDYDETLTYFMIAYPITKVDII